MSDEPRVQADALAALLVDCDREIARAQHGLRRAYELGCRCFSCRRANADYQRRRYRTHATGKRPLGQHVPAGLLSRRVDALKREGFSVEDIAARARLHPDTLKRDHRRVTVRTFLAVAALYRRHCGEG